MDRLAITAAALLISGQAHAASESVRNKFAIAFASTSLAQDTCGYNSNDVLLATRMNEAGITNKTQLNELTYSTFMIQLMQSSLAEIAINKAKWCEDVWRAFGDDGTIERGAVSDRQGTT